MALLARTDPLTGLANRRGWQEELRRELARAEREGSRLSVAIIDLDRFKAFNDDRGHAAGDRLLKEAAARWANEIRTMDLIARYGGEEFALILPGANVHDSLLARADEALYSAKRAGRDRVHKAPATVTPPPGPDLSAQR